MLVMIRFAISALTLFVVLPLAAQENRVTVLYSNYVKPKVGMRREYEDAAKRHLEWHRKNKDPWPINVWEIISGERTGQYSYGIGHRHWHDFDTRGSLEEADMADYYATASSFVESIKVTYYIHMPELSRPAPPNPPRPLVEVMRYRVKMDGIAGFLGAARKIHEAIQKSDAPVYYNIYQLYNGGEHPTYAFRFPRKKFAEFEPLDPSVMAILEKAYGREEAESVMKSYSGSIVSVESEIAAARPDMSYKPE